MRTFTTLMVMVVFDHFKIFPEHEFTMFLAAVAFCVCVVQDVLEVFRD